LLSSLTEVTFRGETRLFNLIVEFRPNALYDSAFESDVMATPGRQRIEPTFATQTRLLRVDSMSQILQFELKLREIKDKIRLRDKIR